jgi:hypothetical protein
VFKNKMLNRIFGKKIVKVAGGWTKLHNEGLHNLYFSTSIIRMVKLKRMGREVHVHSWGRTGMHIRFW